MPRAFSMVGLLVTMVCIVILFSLLMTSLNKAVTGEGSTKENTVHSVQDEMNLVALHQSLFAEAQQNKGYFACPSRDLPDHDIAQNTTANLYSILIAQNLIAPSQLISANEFSGYVEEKTDYNFNAYNPVAGSYWDQTFLADLEDLSNTSFAHVPLVGDRLKQHWNANLSSSTPIISNRGPKDGIDNPASRTYGRSGKWGGHLLFADGHVAFTSAFSINAPLKGSDLSPDNLFKMESGPDGLDAILSFTSSIQDNIPKLQFD